MVLEAFAAVSLTGNIIQFLNFSCSLLNKTRDIHRAASGLPIEHLELDTISQDLTTLSANIKTELHSDPILATLANRCGILSTELLAAVKELHNVHTTFRSLRWKSFRQALKSIWEKDRIAEMQSRLNNLRDQVMVHYVSRIG